MSVSALHDSTSAAYKKAQRLHEKTTKNRNNDLEVDWTPFRAAEKLYKARFPPPNLSNVLDLAMLDNTRSNELEAGFWTGSRDSIEATELPLKSASDSSRAYAIPAVPGTNTSSLRSAYLTLNLRLGYFAFFLISPEATRSDIVGSQGSGEAPEPHKSRYTLSTPR